MGRLIDAELLQENFKHHCCRNCNKCEYSTFLSDNEHCGLIDAQPTAYDPGEVVKQLEKQGITMSTEKFPHKYFKAISVKRAIEIVRGGESNG